MPEQPWKQMERIVDCRSELSMQRVNLICEQRMLQAKTLFAAMEVLSALWTNLFLAADVGDTVVSLGGQKLTKVGSSTLSGDGVEVDRDRWCDTPNNVESEDWIAYETLGGSHGYICPRCRGLLQVG